LQTANQRTTDFLSSAHRQKDEEKLVLVWGWFGNHPISSDNKLQERLECL